MTAVDDPIPRTVAWADGTVAADRPAGVAGRAAVRRLRDGRRVVRRDPHARRAGRARARRDRGVRRGARGGSAATTSRPPVRSLIATRPTAVNLAWGVERVSRPASSRRGRRARRGATARRRGRRAQPGARRARRRLLLPDGARVLTHCNAGVARVRRLRHRARRACVPRRGGQAGVGVGRRDPAGTAGRAAHRVGADAARHPARRWSPTWRPRR